MLLKDAEVLATLAVRDTARARRFYVERLGLEVESEETGMLTLRCGGSTVLLVYESQFAGTNQATGATFAVQSGIEALVRSLEAKGVVFEQYDLPDVVRDGALHRGQGRTVAWCKDPDGNILCLAQE